MSEHSWPDLWRKLTNNQRLFLMNRVTRPHEQVPQPMAIVAGRAIDRLRLANSAQADLAKWAQANGYARRDGPVVRTLDGREVVTWRFSEPCRTPRADPDRVAQLATAGYSASAIARHLGVSRERIRQVAGRHGLTLPAASKSATSTGLDVAATAVDRRLGEQVKANRVRIGLSQQRLADEMNVRQGTRWYQTTVGKIESGTRPMRVNEAVAVAEVLGVRLAQLLDPPTS